MYPILIDLPALHVHVWSASALIMLAVVFYVVVAPRWAEALVGLERRKARRAVIILAVIALAGARLHVLLAQPQVYAGHPLDALKLWTGRFHVPGGIIALVLAAPLVTRHYGLSLGKFGDGTVPSVGVAVAIARLGCLLAGCCFGTVCDRPWCFSYGPGTAAYAVHGDLGLIVPGAARSMPVHPLQLYFAAAGLLVTLVALWLNPRKSYDGQVALVALLLFSASSAVLESFREPYLPRVYWGPLPQLMWTTLAMTGASLLALVGAGVVHRRRIGSSLQVAEST